MRTFATLSSGLVLGLLAALLFLRAGIPPALAALVLWMVGGVIGLSLLQYAFLQDTVRTSTRAARENPLRAFLVGVLVLMVPFLSASCFKLAGAQELGALSLLLFFSTLLLILWPANIAYIIGERLAPELSRTRQVAAGSFVAATSLLIPVFGWIWLFYLAALSTGGFCLRGRYA